jgi:nucleotide-binding universal stress UspA family protein
MFHQILVPLDGSPLAERALPLARQLARTSNGTLHLVRVAEPTAMAWANEGGYVPEASYDAMIGAEREQAASYLEAVRGRVAASGLAVRSAERSGDVASELIDYERDAGIDLVVICSHGRSGLARFALGSIAARLLRHGAVPLLVVRAFGEPASLERAVVPLDGSTQAEEALRAVRQLAPALLREVTLLRAIGEEAGREEAERYLASVAEQLRVDGLTCERRVAQGNAAQAILEAAGEDTPVIMATHGRSGMTRWALGSVADRVAHGGAPAVLLVRIGASAQDAG